MDSKIVILFVVISSFNPVNMYDISVISKGKGFHTIICGRVMIGLSLSSVSKHNMWSCYDWVVVVVVRQ